MSERALHEVVIAYQTTYMYILTYHRSDKPTACLSQDIYPGMPYIFLNYSIYKNTFEVQTMFIRKYKKSRDFPSETPSLACQFSIHG